MIQIAEREGVHPYGQLQWGLQRCWFVTVYKSQMRTKGKATIIIIMRTNQGAY